jgi:hypothetical protein
MRVRNCTGYFWSGPKESGLDWIVVRPVYLTNGPRTGKYQVWTGRRPIATTGRISQADVADFMLKQLSDNTYLRKTPGLSYWKAASASCRRIGLQSLIWS